MGRQTKSDGCTPALEDCDAHVVLSDDPEFVLKDLEESTIGGAKVEVLILRAPRPKPDIASRNVG